MASTTVKPVRIARQLRRHHHRRGRGRLREVKRRVLAENRGVQSVQFGSRLDADLVTQSRAQAPEGFQGVDLASAAEQRQHPCRDEFFAERVVGDPVGEVDGNLLMAPACEAPLRVLTDGGKAHLVESARSRLQGSTDHIGQCRTAPQREALADRVGGRGHCTALGKPLRLDRPSREDAGVDLVGYGRQAVAGMLGEQIHRDSRQCPTQRRDRVMDLFTSGRRWLAVPEDINQLLRGDQTPGVDQKCGEQPAWAGTGDPDLLVASPGLHTSKNSELHRDRSPSEHPG